MRNSINRPRHSVSIARIIGTKPDGGDTLGAAHDIGAVWPRRDKPGGILRLDQVPVEATSHQGVLLFTPVNSDAPSSPLEAYLSPSAATKAHAASGALEKALSWWL